VPSTRRTTHRWFNVQASCAVSLLLVVHIPPFSQETSRYLSAQLTLRMERDAPPYRIPTSFYRDTSGTHPHPAGNLRRSLHVPPLTRKQNGLPDVMTGLPEIDAGGRM
jgi:hypothetical protein